MSDTGLRSAPLAAATLTALLLVPRTADAQSRAYDPLAVTGPVPGYIDLTVRDATRDREIPIRAYLPPTSTPAPVILFSHGLGGARTNNSYLGEHWARRGYLVVYLQHAGSDESVWRSVPPARMMAAMRQAASGANLLLRAEDVGAVLDQLGRWHRTRGHPLAGRADLERVGMSGHSFGAVTTQAVSGQRIPGTSLTDRRIDAALPMSPSAPARGSAADAFGAVGIPWLLMTGTLDGSPIRDLEPEDRLAVYPALPPGRKYELVLHGAEHSAFGDRALRGDEAPRNPNHHRAILALGTAFWDAMLRNDPAARAWLDGAGPRGVLEPADRWQRK